MQNTPSQNSIENHIREYLLCFVSTLLCIVTILLLNACAPEDEKEVRKRKDTEEKVLRQAMEERSSQARELFMNAKRLGQEMRIEEALTMLDQSEKLDPSLKFEIGLYINSIGDDHVKRCDQAIKTDSPKIVYNYLNNTQRDPIIVGHRILNFIVSESRFKDITRKNARDTLDTLNKVKFARETYLQAHHLIESYKRSEGVERLRLLSREYRDTHWGIAAGEYLISIGEQ